MQRSGHNNPCPSCGRTKDKDCAWNEEIIFCHNGSSNGPDPSLRLGDTLLLNGTPWALVKTDAGFSGSAHVFKPHQDREWTEPSGVNRRQLLDRRARRAVAAFSIERFLNRFDQAWNLPDFHILPPDKLRDAFSLIAAVRTDSIELEQSLPTIWQDHRDLQRLYQDRIKAAQQGITALHEDSIHFRRHYLGEAA